MGAGIDISKWDIGEAVPHPSGDMEIPMDIPEEDLKWIWDNYEMTAQEWLDMIAEDFLSRHRLNKNHKKD